MPRIYDPHDRDRWYENAAWHRKPSGSIVENGKEVATTLFCVHHGGHFVYRKDMGRNVCLKCGGEVCPLPRCNQVCMHIEQRLDLYESGKIGSM